MTKMTIVEIERWVQRAIYEAGGLLAYARQQRIPTSTLCNALKRRHAWTPYTLRCVGLVAVQIVEEAAATDVPKPVVKDRPYRKMWRLGDWPSRYAVTAEC